MANYRILSCDGGGIRGLLTALIVRRLHTELHILDRVNLHAGTSTGGIIALGLAAGKPIDEVVDLYQSKANEIFVRPDGIGTKAGEIAKLAAKKAASRIPNITPELIDSLFTYQDELWYPRYSGEGLRKVLSGLFPHDPTLASMGGEARVMVTTFRLHDEQEGSWRPEILHNLGPIDDASSSHVVEAAMCTSAAPTYFPPHKHSRLGYCVDGGLFANNPSSLALASALKAGQPMGSIRLLSIGTGATKNSMTIPHTPLFRRGPENYGILGWLFPRMAGDTPSYPLLNALFEAGSATSHHIASEILGPKQYQRVQVPLKESIGLDKVDAIPDIKALSESFFTSDAWPKVRRWVEEEFS
jgi:hypothetical protein